MSGTETGPVAVDLRAIQSPDHRGRGVARYAYDLALALERRRPDLVGRYLLAPDWPPPGDIEALLDTGKVAYLGGGDELPDATRVYHSMSPFELGIPTGAVWPPLVERRGLRFSATVYDLIPLRHSAAYLADPRQRRRYLTRLEVLRQADALLSISAAAHADVLELVGVPADRITTIGTGVAAHLRPPRSRFAAFEAARSALPGLADPFVLYPGGSDGRKNVEALLAAFAALPRALRDGHQLVVPCDLPPLRANHFRHLADTLGIADRLVLPGYVPDRVLELLYQATSLVCFPSLAEGFGLPIAEALACGAVAVASDRPPMSDLVGPDARFDPTDPSDIARAIERGLSDPSLRAGAAAAATQLDSWDEVAERAGKALESLAGARPHPWRRHPRLAFVSPFPPVSSGVAAYSARLIEALGQREELAGVELDCFADGRDRDPVTPTLPGDRPWSDARVLSAVEGATGGYDDVVYVLGNSEYHAGALASLRRRPGLVMAHEVRLGNLLRFSVPTPGAAPGGIPAAIRRAYGSDLPSALGEGDQLSAEDEERYGLLLLRDVLSCTDRLTVSSEAARRLGEVDAGPELSGRLGVVPFALAMRPAELDAVKTARGVGGAPGGPGAPVTIASFGIVHRSKQPFVLLDAVAELARRRAGLVSLAFVGPVSDELDCSLRSRADEAGVVDLTVTGELSRPDYLAWLGRATVAVQLRTGFNGEASAAVGDCLAAGLPTVVTRIGWLAELPDESVVKLARHAGPTELADRLEELLDDPGRSASLSAAAAAHAASLTFDQAAGALARLLRLRHGQPTPLRA